MGTVKALEKSLHWAIHFLFHTTSLRDLKVDRTPESAQYLGGEEANVDIVQNLFLEFFRLETIGYAMC